MWQSSVPNLARLGERNVPFPALGTQHEPRPHPARGARRLLQPGPSIVSHGSQQFRALQHARADPEFGGRGHGDPEGACGRHDTDTGRH